RDEMIAWFDANNRNGPKSDLAKEWTGTLLAATKPEEDLHLALGPNLLKSRTVTYLSACGDSFFVFELTPAEAKRSGVDNMRCKVDHGRRPEPRRRVVELHSLRIEDGTFKPGRQEIVCSLTYKNLEKPEGKLALRLNRRVAGKDNFT